MGDVCERTRHLSGGEIWVFPEECTSQILRQHAPPLQKMAFPRQTTHIVTSEVAFGERIRLAGGGGGIRTHETLSGLTVFKTAGFNRSPTPPNRSGSHIVSCVRAQLQREGG